MIVWGLLMSAKPAHSDGAFGLGVIVGEPTGVSAKAWLSGRTAFDLAAAWSFADESAFHVHADYLVHFFDRIDVDRGALPFYAGIGGRLKTGDEDDFLGVRIPVGLVYLMEEAPMDFFVEIVPLLDLAPSTEYRLNAAVGARFFFD